MLYPVTITLVVIPFILTTVSVEGAAVPPIEPLGPLEPLEGQQTLTHIDLSNLPMDNKTITVPKHRHQDLMCKSLRMKMHISDGWCTSIKPVSSVLCVGHCLPEGDLPWYVQTLKFWGQSKSVEFRCEDDVVKRKRVELVCENGETKKITMKVVRSCKCTRYNTEQNRPLSRKYDRPGSSPIQDLSTDNTSEKANNDHRTWRRKKNGKRKRQKHRRRKNRKRDRKTSTKRTPSEL